MSLITVILLLVALVLGVVALLGALALLAFGYLVDQASAHDPNFKEPRHEC